ncbi:MAG: D-xylose ABC transporter ATP-binding protein [Candidatus Dactylopiibacterium carminicum]|uniref:D-xylose ABC transporter ATP-binding protein n=1 Tax=Candidatus Dactylopiibacterium carminicum TaxID=857335 RepID=A0A272EW07_9RHOO|nr:D-xylose ABC transporter ATP-binding protein [Candidatus Dactylopiibacterium carminicum]KAF7599513.1 D-xylose ABC transporter ATP-binding protein [Candidatus Dactylopiibacterium carminicum]PAS94293.1 MAG: D-xylose ABC transporter ATP-binding protein [Candidatus Dactylopiibacterium carminicum]PAS99519.1 MAG: xylose ABC transporter ATP-binding protein [Candidatus Dactylopiibacterium carminicum]
MADYLLEMRGIVKAFSGVKALNGIDLRVRPGECVGLCGENGAGKSTLMKVLSAVYPYGDWEGSIHWDGQELRARGVRETETAGIVIIHQELMLVPHLSVTENVFLGNEITTRLGTLDYAAMHRRAAELMAELKMPHVNVARPVAQYGGGHQQLIEIAKALNKRARLLILDEPTSSLTKAETAILLDIIRDLKRKGVACVMISHKLDEIEAVCDTITVIRDGRHIGTRPMGELTVDQIITMMVGREITELFPREAHEIGEVVFEARHVTCHDIDNPMRKRVDDVSFSLRHGEILGVAGLVGAGRTEMAMAIFGSYPGRHGLELRLDGQPLRVRSPQEAVEAGICLVPEDRKRHGIVPLMGVGYNITLSVLQHYARLGLIDEAAELKAIEEMIARLHIKTASPLLAIRGLSGGNQQKAVLAKMLLARPRVLILDEPTRGVDVGAKYEIYKLMMALVKEGVAILMISSELPELLGVSDRVLVSGEGRLRGDFINDGLSQETVMAAAIGQIAEAA